MQVTLHGTVEKVGEVETRKNFSKKELRLRIDQDTDYPQLIAVEFTQKNIDRLNLICEGDEVEIQADLRGREWENRVYINLSGWKCTVMASKPEELQDYDHEELADSPSYASACTTEFDDEDNLPF